MTATGATGLTLYAPSLERDLTGPEGPMTKPYLAVTGDAGLVGIVDITDVCTALLDLSEAAKEPASDP